VPHRPVSHLALQTAQHIPGMRALAKEFSWRWWPPSACARHPAGGAIGRHPLHVSITGLDTTGLQPTRSRMSFPSWNATVIATVNPFLSSCCSWCQSNLLLLPPRHQGGRGTWSIPYRQHT
jgi:hypothetical protein